jgi:hypothetical protein
MKRHGIAILPVCVTLALFVGDVGAQAPAAGAAGGQGSSGSGKTNAATTKPAQSTTGTAASQSGLVAYSGLKNKKVSLPYGQPFTITGHTEDVQLPGGALKDLMTVTSVSGDYADSDGTNGTISASGVTGTSWQVTIGKLAADTSVTINFRFAGTLSDSQQEAALVTMLNDPAYQAALSKFKDASEKKASTEQMAAAAQMAPAAADALIAALGQNGLTPKDTAALKTALTPAILGNFEPIYNLPSKLSIVRNLGTQVAVLINLDSVAFSKLSDQDLYNQLKAVKDFSKLPTQQDTKTKDAIQKAVQDFVATFESAGTAMAGLKAAAFTGTSSLTVGQVTQTNDVSDLQEYAGFDVGAMYSYRLSELRSFAIVNIYLGPVQSSTDAQPPKPGKVEWWRQRVSLAFGMALKDLSGSSSSKVTSQNAFAYGVGFRLNKYFRLSAGGLLYRTTLPAVNGVTSPANGTLRNEIFVGPSIDITAWSALKSIFAKATTD